MTLKQNPHSSILHITDHDIINNISIKECINVTEEAFLDYASKFSTMPNKVYLDLPQFNGDFRAMPAYNQRYHIAGIKWVNSHACNQNIGLPSVSASMIINNPETAEIIAIMDATAITSLRTGAAGALGVKYCSSTNHNSIAFIGAGNQANHQFNCISEIRSLTTINIFDPNTENANHLKESIKRKSSATINIHKDIETAVRESTIIVTTTPAKSPIIKKEWLQPTAHINAIGADAKGKQECDFNIIKNAQIIVDDIEQTSHCGEINQAITKHIISSKDIKASLDELIQNKQQVNQNELSLFDSTGLAIQDLAIAGYYLTKNHHHTKKHPL